MHFLPTGLTTIFAPPPTVYPRSEIAKVGDAVRCTITVEKLEQIPLLLSALIKQVHEAGGQIWMKNNYWKDKNILTKGYVGLHMRMCFPVPGKLGSRLLTEVQIHPKDIMDGTRKCAKEVTHRFYKISSANSKEDREICSCSQLIFLTSMAKLLSNEQELKEARENVDQYLEINNIISEQQRNFEHLIIETALLLKKDKDTLGSGKFIPKYQAVLPDNPQAIAGAWMETADRINSLLEELGVTSQFEGLADLSTVENTAESFEELRKDASLVSSLFNTICVLSANQPGCAVTYGEDGNILKSEKSLREKLDEPRRLALRKKPRVEQCLTKIKDPQQAVKIAKKGMSLISVLTAFGSTYGWYTANNTIKAMEGGFVHSNSRFNANRSTLLPDQKELLKGIQSFQNLSMKSPETTANSINSLINEVFTCNHWLNSLNQAKADAEGDTTTALQRFEPINDCFKTLNATLHHGYAGLPSDVESAVSEKLKLSQVSIQNIEESTATLSRWCLEALSCNRELLKCEKEKQQAIDGKEADYKALIDAKDETIKNLKKQAEENKIKDNEIGKCTVLQDTLPKVNEKIELQRESCQEKLEKCLPEQGRVGTLQTTLTACETARDNCTQKKDYESDYKNCANNLEEAKKKWCYIPYVW